MPGHTLWQDGRATTIEVDPRASFLGRLRGLLGRASLPDRTCIWLQRCGAVHTFGMRFPIDLAFVSRGGFVLRVESAVPPACLRWHPRATSVIEAPAGALRRWRVRVGTHVAFRPEAAAVGSAGHQAGSVTLEFVAAAMLIVLPLAGAVFEGAQLAITRQLLTVSAFEAARTGAVTGGDLQTMRRRLARGLAPLFGASDAARRDAGALRAYSRALLDVQRPDRTRIDIVRPTAVAFADFGIEGPGGPQIPNDGDALDARRGERSGLTLAQANVLAIEVRYCRSLIVPVLDGIITTLVLRIRADVPVFDRACLAQQRLPITVRAVATMQTPARAAALGIDG
jgi:uncharacterized membrane protein (UPF0127 family)